MDDPTARLTEDSSITEVRDVRPELFPESCRETIEKFQQLDKLSDAELDFIVSYELLCVKDARKLALATRIAPAKLGERMMKQFLSKQTPISNEPVGLWDVILAQRQFVNDACFLYSRGNIRVRIEPVLGPNLYLEDASPLADEQTAKENKLRLKELLAQQARTAIPSHKEDPWYQLLHCLPKRSPSPPDRNTMKNRGESAAAARDPAEKLNDCLTEFVVQFAKHLWPLGRGLGVHIDDSVVDNNDAILDDHFDTIRKGESVAFLTLETIDEPVCLYISPGLAADVADAFVDQNHYRIDGDVHRFIIEHLYEVAGGFLRHSFEGLLGLKAKRFDVLSQHASAESLFSKQAGARMVNLLYGVNFGNPDPDYPSGHLMTIAVPIKLCEFIESREDYSSPRIS